MQELGARSHHGVDGVVTGRRGQGQHREVAQRCVDVVGYPDAGVQRRSRDDRHLHRLTTDRFHHGAGDPGERAQDQRVGAELVEPLGVSGERLGRDEIQREVCGDPTAELAPTVAEAPALGARLGSGVVDDDSRPGGAPRPRRDRP